jgi:hypothetical protein
MSEELEEVEDEPWRLAEQMQRLLQASDIVKSDKGDVALATLLMMIDGAANAIDILAEYLHHWPETAEEVVSELYEIAKVLRSSIESRPRVVQEEDDE